MKLEELTVYNLSMDLGEQLFWNGKNSQKKL